MMAWNPLKSQGLMCHRWDCEETGVLHGITRVCGKGHRETLWYCGEHIDDMMALAIHPPGILPDGTLLGIPLCKTCNFTLHLVVE